LSSSCGARTPLHSGETDGGGEPAGDAGVAFDGGVISFGLCTLERGAALIVGGERNQFPTMARGEDSIMLAFTRQELDGRFIYAVPLTPRGIPTREPRSITQGHGGTIAALLDGTTFGLLYLDDGEGLTGIELTPDTSITGPPRSFGDSTLQVQPALAIGDAALGFGWTTSSGTTSRLFMGDDDSGREEFTEVIIEGHDVHAAQVRSATGRIRYLTIVGDVAQTRTFAIDGDMVGDIGTVGLMGGGRVMLGAAVSNRTDDGVVVAGTNPVIGAVVGVVHERGTRRIEASPAAVTPIAVDAAADAREAGWVLAGVSWEGPGRPILELYATNGSDDVVMPIGPIGLATSGTPHPTILAPSRADEPFLVAWESDHRIEIACVFCAR
jgi:hypothetical protein